MWTPLWTQADAVGKAVFLLLIALSVLSWSIMLMKAMQWRSLLAAARRVHQHFWEATDVELGLEALGDGAEPYRAALNAQRQALAHHRAHPQHLHIQLTAQDWLAAAAKLAVDETTRRLQGGLTLLASIASTAPFIGLFGTVWGIHRALLAIQASGQASLAFVAGPIGETLVMTALGLAVAVPATLGYNLLARAMRDEAAAVARFAQATRPLLLTGGQPRAFTPRAVRAMDKGVAA